MQHGKRNTNVRPENVTGIVVLRGNGHVHLRIYHFQWQSAVYQIPGVNA
jgi:hypothetical protein